MRAVLAGGFVRRDGVGAIVVVGVDVHVAEGLVHPAVGAGAARVDGCVRIAVAILVESLIDGGQELGAAGSGRVADAG